MQYLNNVMALLPTIETTADTVRMKNNNYDCLTDIFEYFNRRSKILKGMVIPVFDIQVNTNFFTTCFQFNKPYKIYELGAIVLNKEIMMFHET